MTRDLQSREVRTPVRHGTAPSSESFRRIVSAYLRSCSQDLKARFWDSGEVLACMDSVSEHDSSPFYFICRA